VYDPAQKIRISSVVNSYRKELSCDEQSSF
jgi:hypothetical protein